MNPFGALYLLSLLNPVTAPFTVLATIGAGTVVVGGGLAMAGGLAYISAISGPPRNDPPYR